MQSAANDTAPGYEPARRPNPAAAERALYYVGHYGSADAALEAVECPGHDDAFDRTVNQELRALRHIECTAAKAEREAAQAESLAA
jgi:hypothetical protein